MNAQTAATLNAMPVSTVRETAASRTPVAFGIKHKLTGKFFGGFTDDNSVKWVDQCDAHTMTQRQAYSQALLFRRFDLPAQIKPVAFEPVSIA